MARMNPVRLANRRWTLAQAPATPLLVTVRDVNGRPLAGAIVEARSPDGTLVESGAADSAGDVRFSVPLTGTVELVARFGDYVRRVSVDAGRNETAIIQFPICAPVPFLTTAEGAALVLGGAITAAGFYWKEDAAKLLGEILVGGAVFTLIFRHSCL